jgi:hypothetical protein
MDFICTNIIKSDIDSILSKPIIPSSVIPSPITIPTVDITEDVINGLITMTSSNYAFNMKNNETIKSTQCHLDITEDVINTFIKMTCANYAFNMKNTELIKSKQRLLDIYVSYANIPTRNIREELSRVRAYKDYSSSALDTWKEGNNYILYKGAYIGMLFNTARKAATALAAALNREYWLESLIKNDVALKISLRTAVEEASNVEIEARNRLYIAIDEPNINKSLIEIYNNILSNHLSLAKVVAELSISPLCIEMLDDNSDLNVIKANINNIFTSISPNMEYINILYNTIKVANNASDINTLKAFEEAKNNVIVELTNIYMYELNEGIRISV